MASAWFSQNKKLLNRFDNLSIIYLNIDESIDKLSSRSMKLQANISDGELNLIDEDQTITITETIWKS